ncbi:MAG: hypothetical protein H6654_08585 [Ardenticatenaceae bacterium]|nr:hypothetical protein [Ardenticatenaceae bacterium]MCB8973599.1 hypothetical protein [Ardenticatenaceae bacterium]
MEQTANGIPVSLRAAFQEYTLEQLHPQEHQFTVIERTLAFGDREELRWLFAYFGQDTVREWCADYGHRLLPRRRYLFWANYFDLSLQPPRNGAWKH